MRLDTRFTIADHRAAYIFCCLAQVGIFSYELLKNIKELKIYQDIFDMDAKPTCHVMK